VVRTDALGVLVVDVEEVADGVAEQHVVLRHPIAASDPRCPRLPTRESVAPGLGGATDDRFIVLVGQPKALVYSSRIINYV